MTCIAGLVRDNKVYVGGDSASISAYDSIPRLDPKVFKLNNMVIGVTGSFRMGQLLRYSEPPKYSGDDHPDNLMKYMVTLFVPFDRKLLKDAGFAKVSDSEETGGQFMVGFAGSLFIVHSDYQVEMPGVPFAAVGYGCSYALGALDVLHESDKVPYDIIYEALDVSSRYCAAVRPPYTILNI